MSSIRQRASWLILGPLIAVASCTHRDDINLAANTWTIGDKSFSATTVSRSPANILSAVADGGSDTSTILFTFQHAPVNGDYLVRSTLSDSASVMVDASYTRGGVRHLYHCTGSNGVRATVSVTAGKVTLSMPFAAARASGGDSVEVSALAITEN